MSWQNIFNKVRNIWNMQKQNEKVQKILSKPFSVKHTRATGLQLEEVIMSKDCYYYFLKGDIEAFLLKDMFQKQVNMRLTISMNFQCVFLYHGGWKSKNGISKSVLQTILHENQVRYWQRDGLFGKQSEAESSSCCFSSFLLLSLIKETWVLRHKIGRQLYK